MKRAGSCYTSHGEPTTKARLRFRKDGGWRIGLSDARTRAAVTPTHTPAHRRILPERPATHGDPDYRTRSVSSAASIAGIVRSA